MSADDSNISAGAQRGHGQRERLEGWQISHVAGVDAGEVLRHVREHLARSEAGTADAIKSGPRGSIARGSLRTRQGEVEVATKWFRWRGLRRALGERASGSRARRAMRGAERIAALGLRTPEILAVAERRERGIVRDGVLIARFLSEARSLQEELRHLEGNEPAALNLARLLGRELATLHAAGVHHPDLKLSNIMVCPGPALAWIDLDALVPPKTLSFRRRVRALGQLEAYTRFLAPWVGKSARGVFLDAYLARDPAVAPRRAALARGAAAWATEKVRAWQRLDGTRPPEFAPPAEDPRPM